MDTQSRVGEASVVWLAQLGLSAFYFAHMFLSQFSIASCTATSCDYSLFASIMQVFNFGLAATLVASAVGIYALRRRGRWAMWVPLLGIIVATVLIAVAYPWSRAALELPLFGDRV